jgi:hypothetical protein
MAPSPVGRVLTAVDKPFPKGFGQIFVLSKILIISMPLPSEKGVKAMVKIIVPLSIEAIASFLGRIDDPDVVEITFSDHINSTTQFLCLSVNDLPDVVQNVPGTEIEDTMGGVDSKAVHVIFRHPVKGIPNDEVADLVALRTIEVDCRTPWGLVAVSEIGSVISKIVPLRS